MNVTITEHEKPKVFTPFTLNISFDTEEEYTAFYMQMNAQLKDHPNEAFEQLVTDMNNGGKPALTAAAVDEINSKLFWKLPWNVN